MIKGNIAFFFFLMVVFIITTPGLALDATPTKNNFAGPSPLIQKNTLKKDSFLISGHVTGLANGKGRLEVKGPDSIVSFPFDIVQEKFKIRGSLPSPQLGYLYVEGVKNYKDFFVENTGIRIECNNDLSIFTVKGSESQLVFEKFKEYNESHRLKVMAHYDTYTKAMKENRGLLDSLDKVSAKMALEEQKSILRFIGMHINSPVSAYLLTKKFNTINDLKILDSTYYFLGKRAKESVYGRQLKQTMEKSQSTFLGKKAPEILVSGPDNSTVSLSSLKGKIVLIDFWASWCVPCIREFPALKKVYSDFRNKGFEIFGVSFDDDKTDWLKALKKHTLPWPNGSDLKATASKTYKDYGINFVPANFLIDENGIIVARNIPTDALAVTLKKLISAKEVQ